MRITVAGIGYVGLSNAVLLAQNNEIIALDIIQERVDMINNRKSPIKDEEIEEYLATKELKLIATTDKYKAYKDAEYIIISTPTNYDPKKIILTPKLLRMQLQMYCQLILKQLWLLNQPFR